MGDPNAKPPEHTKWKPGQSGNPAGKPKGTKHISTWIQEMLNDEEFEATLIDSAKGAIQYKGAPLKAIIGTAIQKSLHDKEKGQQWAEWLAKHGYGTKLTIATEDPIEALLKAYGIGGNDDGQTDETVSGSSEVTT